MTRILIVGSGNIGAQVERQAEAAGCEVVGIISGHDIRFGPGLAETRPINRPTTPEQVASLAAKVIGAEVAVIATPSNGSEALWMDYFLRHGVPIALAAKHTLAYSWPKYESARRMIGHQAVVGGGTGLLGYVRTRKLWSQAGEVTVQAVLNGTLNLIWAGLAEGRGMVEVLREAKALRYAEPGQDDLLELIRGELVDVRLKAAIFHNSCLIDDVKYAVKPNMSSGQLFRPVDLSAVRDPRKRVRYVVTFRSLEETDAEVEDISPGSFTFSSPRWRIHGAFEEIPRDSALGRFIPPGVGNGVRIEDANGVVLLTGPGAGPEPTAAALLRDVDDIMEAQAYEEEIQQASLRARVGRQSS